MTTQTVAIEDIHQEARASWVPMIAIALGQMIMSFNVASLPVAMGGMVTSFGVAPTTVATGIVAYSMLVAGFVMLGAKLAQRFGALQVYRGAVVLFCISQVMMTFSPTASVMISAQALCGAAGSVIVPSLVALIAENYAGRQQATALGALGSARAAAGVLAFVVGGVLGTYIGWRPAFGILIAASAIVFVMSFRLKPDRGRPDVQIDLVGVLLAASAIILISFGFNNLNGWGLAVATPNAPFSVLGLSPAPLMIVLGIVLGQSFLLWTHRRQAAGKTPLLALAVIDSPEERCAVFALFAVVALEAALNFTVPLFGIGQGSLVTLLFNVLVTASPKALAGDVGSLRGTTQNLAAAVGTAVAGALLVGLLSTIALGKITASPVLTPELQAQVNLDNITFVSNDRLRSALEATNGSPEQVTEAVRVNTEARLRALKIGLLIMAGLALIAIIPAGRLPGYLPGDIPSDEAAAKT